MDALQRATATATAKAKITFEKQSDTITSRNSEAAQLKDGHVQDQVTRESAVVPPVVSDNDDTESAAAITATPLLPSLQLSGILERPGPRKYHKVDSGDDNETDECEESLTFQKIAAETAQVRIPCNEQQ
jgi:hypothetical protein